MDAPGNWVSQLCEGELNIGSPCVQRNLIDVLNAFFSIVYALLICLSKAENHKSTWFFVLVSICCAAAGVAYVFSALFIILSREKRVLCEILRGVYWIILAISLNLQRNKWSKTISLVWWISFSLLISAYNVEVVVTNQKVEILELVSWPINLLLLCCSLILLFSLHQYSSSVTAANTLTEPLLVENNNTIPKKSDLYGAGIFSRATFSWLNQFLKLGQTKPLNLDDIPSLDSEDTSLEASQRFLAIWRAYAYLTDKSKTNLILLALFNCYKWDLLLTAFYALLRTVSVTISPLLLFAFIAYSNSEERETGVGITLVISLIGMKIVESVSQRHWFFESRRCGMRMRSALMACIFEKQLKVSNNGRKKHATGEIVNYIGVDAYRLGDFPWWLHMAWTCPLQLLVAIAILFWSLGVGAIPGLVPLLIFGALNLPFAKLLQGFQSKFMVAQDERLRATSEALNNMKIIKLQSWEERFRRMVGCLRDGEFKWLGEIQLKKAYGTALYWMAPTVVSSVMFAGAALTGSAPLNASTIFTVLATLRVMSEPVRMLPEILTTMIQVKVSLDRIQVFLLEDEIDVKRGRGGQYYCNKDKDRDLVVKIEGGVFSWEPIGSGGAVPSSSTSTTLRDVGLEVLQGQKVAVCGPVGAGKSSLLYALLGEILQIKGSVEVYGSVAYVSQNAWIQSGTIRENILFGNSFDKERYEKAVKACALDKDIENFANGDGTEIGQRGVNMSGGQKQRIQLARAVYSDADVCLLDDPFSAVDAHTAATLFYDCVMGALANKTVILVTHQVEFLSEVDTILVMENGQITQQGSYNELLRYGTPFEKLVKAHRSSITALERSNFVTTKQERDPDVHVVQPTLSEEKERGIYIATKSRKTLSTQLTEEEEKGIGDLGWKPYKDYLSVSKGYSHLQLLICAQVLFVVTQSISTYWVAIAVELPAHIGSQVLVGVYAVFSTVSCIFSYYRSYFSAQLGLKASKAFFDAFTNSIFNAPMVFFDSTPVGRILTRASSDLSILDFDIPYCISFVVAGSIEIAMTIIIMSTVTWQVLIIAIPVIFIMMHVQRYYVASARELVRINGTTKAPVMNYASESMLGVVTIRAYEDTERFIRRSLGLIDEDASLFFHTIASLEWVLLRVEMLQLITVVISALFLIFLPNGVIAPGLMGLCLSYSLNLTACQSFMTRYYSSLEQFIISVERMKQYMEIPAEPPAVIQEYRPSPSWPSQGHIQIKNLKVKYRGNAPLVLKGISCSMRAGEKIGVVGRTGSGKSTLISCLFRLVDPTGGQILIDGLDICLIGLKDLRTKLSIIPQEPTLFRGTVRTNLDPLALHSDQEIWEVLDKCQLKSTISELPKLLDAPVSDDGENWSVGQRQLFCLGRVLLRKNRILVLDEATASIDSATDAVLQQVIKHQFRTCTVITIAHRVPTVTHSDMVLLLSYGKLEEYDKPSTLLAQKTSAFSKLVNEYWSNSIRTSSSIEETII